MVSSTQVRYVLDERGRGPSDNFLGGEIDRVSFEASTENYAFLRYCPV